MKTVSKKLLFNVSPEKVFQTLDDLGVTGMHMTQSSAMMLGSKLHLEYLTESHTGLGSKYRWTGKMMGMEMDFSVVVTKWVYGTEKTWETYGMARMIIYSWYRMHLLITKKADRSLAELSITYKKPTQWFAKFISFLFAGWYCRWCLASMLSDAKQITEPINILNTKHMKIRSLKFGLALGLAFSAGFLVCNLLLLAGGTDFTVKIMNLLFHGTDFRLIMTNPGFDIISLISGMGILLLAGIFIGYITASLYNSFIRDKSLTRQ